jgi:hypothetical protein
MKYLIFFESHSNIESLKNEILNNFGLKKLAYDIIDASFDNLDKYDERDDEGEILKKSLIFQIMLNQIEHDYNIGDAIIEVEFSLYKSFSENDINWILSIEKDLKNTIELLKSGLKYWVLLSVIVGEEGNRKQVSCGDIIEKLESMYPDIEFDTFDPWDIN